MLFKRGRAITLRLLCDNCGRRVEKPLHVARKALNQGSRDAYCSRACCEDHHATKNSTAKCLTCGGSVAHRKARYCSDACKRANRAARAKVRQCPRCGAWFGMKPNVSGAKYWTKFCTPACADAAHSERMAGAGNSNFAALGRYSNQYLLMRAVVMERDGAQCAACGEQEMFRPKSVRSTLHVHHIDRNPRNNTPENLITLCQPCHSRHHGGTLTASPLLPLLAQERSMSMTFRLRDRATFLLEAFSSTTASS